MINRIPKISVKIITYNQQELIKRAIASVLYQADYVYEICVSDDCSTDNTWAVLKEYEKQYPGLFKIKRNDKNVGLFENIELSRSMVTGDLVYCLAGDDELGKGWLQTVVDFILRNKIDYINEGICIYGDYKAVYPNGDSFIFKNDAICTRIDPIRLSIRGIIGNRSACYSKALFDRFKRVSQGRSYVPESAQDRQLQVFSDKSFYIPFVGNIYYTRIGINVHFNRKIFEERELVEDYARQFIEAQGYKFSTKDLSFIDYKTEKAKSYRDKSLRHRILVFWLFIKSYDPSLGMKQLRPKRYLFSLVRRLPHKKPISWVI